MVSMIVVMSRMKYSTRLKENGFEEAEKDNTVKNTDTNVTDLVQTLDESDTNALTSGKHFYLFISFFFYESRIITIFVAQRCYAGET